MKPAMNDDEPTLADVGSRFPDWDVWHGIDDLFHARLRDAAPPVMVRGESPDDLAHEILRWKGIHDRG